MIQSKRIEFAGILERIQDERSQAKDIEMRGAGRRPTAKKDEKPNPEINQGNEAETLVQAAIGCIENDRMVNEVSGAQHCVYRGAVGLGAEHLPV